jgi:hypothetical protein
VLLVLGRDTRLNRVVAAVMRAGRDFVQQDLERGQKSAPDLSTWNLTADVEAVSRVELIRALFNGKNIVT